MLSRPHPSAFQLGPYPSPKCSHPQQALKVTLGGLMILCLSPQADLNSNFVCLAQYCIISSTSRASLVCALGVPCNQ